MERWNGCQAVACRHGNPRGPGRHGEFGHGWLTCLRHWFRHLRRSRRQGKIALDRAGFRPFLATARALKARRGQVIYVMVEPNARLFATDNYRKADIAPNAALSADTRLPR